MKGFRNVIAVVDICFSLENWQHETCQDVEFLRCVRLELRDRCWMKLKISTSHCQHWATLLPHSPTDRLTTAVTIGSVWCASVMIMCQTEFDCQPFLCN